MEFGFKCFEICEEEFLVVSIEMKLNYKIDVEFMVCLELFFFVI